jgi:peroxiredoxin
MGILSFRNIISGGKKVSIIQWIGISLIVFLTAEVILLTRQNNHLKELLKGPTTEIFESIGPGDMAEPFTVKLMGGSIKEINYLDSTRNHLIFIFSTSCPHCENNLPFWRRIVQNNRDESITIVGVSIDSFEETQRYLSHKDIGFYICSLADTSFKRKYKINGVPITILINRNGFVQKSWGGELTEEKVQEVQSAMATLRTLAN